MTEFDDAPLVAGTVTGVRSFRVDRLGRLRGPQQGTVWRPGVNDCECRATQPTAMPVVLPTGVTVSRNTITGAAVYYGPDGAVIARYGPLSTAPKHSLASCRCGYYAYTDAASRDYETDGTVAAVVEGWGDVMLGERGFRAQKARVIAVTLPKKDVKSESVDVNRPSGPLSGWAYDNATLMAFEYGVMLLVPAAALAIPAIIGAVMTVAGAPWSGVPWLPTVFVVFSVLLSLAARAFFRASAGQAGRKYRTAVSSPVVHAVDPTLAALVCRNYPDVHVYTDRAVMVAAHPLYRGEEPSPATAGFWELP